MNDDFTKIASKVFLAFTCRKYVMEDGFDYDGADRGLVLFNYNYYPIIWAYPKEERIHIIFTYKADDAFNEFLSLRRSNSPQLGDIGKEIKDWMDEHPRGVICKNFRIMLWNSIHKEKMTKFKNADFLINTHTTLSVEEAQKFFTEKYDISMTDFYRAFGGEVSEDRKFSCEGMNFEVNDSSLTKETVEAKMREVKSKLPDSLASKLIYGKVELKSKFADNAIADYHATNDLIRIDAGDEFVSSMIHELGHRWHYKFCTRLQQRKIEKLYKLCKDNKSDAIGELEYGDVVELYGKYKYCIVDSNDSQYRCYSIDEENPPTRTIPKNFFHTKTVTSVNGKPVDHKYALPRPYAGKNIREFVAVCFEHLYCGKSISSKLAEEMKEIFENG